MDINPKITNWIPKAILDEYLKLQQEKENKIWEAIFLGFNHPNVIQRQRSEDEKRMHPELTIKDKIHIKYSYEK